MTFEYFIGLDLAAQTFVATVLTNALHKVLSASEFQNDPDGWEAFVAWLTKAKVEPHTTVICLEATGVYREALCSYLHAHEWWVAVHAPLEIKRAFAPVGHKTDAIDSRQIAEDAVRFTDKRRRWHPKPDLLEQIKVLWHTREQFVRQPTADKNTLRARQRKAVRTPFAEPLYQEAITQFTKNIQALEKEIHKLLEQDHDLHTQTLLLMTVPGVGLLLAAHALVMRASLHAPYNPRAVSAWLGINPYQTRSGTSGFSRDASRHDGPAIMRKLLHLAARSMGTHHPGFRLSYQRKLAEGKPKQLVLNNIANKLVKIIGAVLREQQPYIPNYRSVNPASLS